MNFLNTKFLCNFLLEYNSKVLENYDYLKGKGIEISPGTTEMIDYYAARKRVGGSQ